MRRTNFPQFMHRPGQLEPYPVEAMAGAGTAVLMPMPRGGYGYGLAGLRQIVGAWGEGDYRDIMAGVDELIEKGVADLYYDSDAGDFTEAYFGLPWEHAGLYQAHSPITLAARVTTPLLLQHGKEDRRVPVMQARKLYKALDRLGKEE